MDNNKILNSRCYCGVGLPWKNDIIVMCYPCEHMLHSLCYKKINKCKICNTPIKKIYTLNDKNLHPQVFADILSMSYYNNMCTNTPTRFADSIFDITSVLINLLRMKTKTDGKELSKQILSLNNLTVRVKGYNKIQPGEKIFIANHISHLELIIIYYLFGAGFLTTSLIKKVGLYDYIQHIIPLLAFDRNKEGSNIVNEIKKFVKTHGSICMFPEGIMSHPRTISRFRSGAFHVGKPIYALAIKYIDIVSDDLISMFLYKLSKKETINIEIDVLGPYLPPFSNDDIENIRCDIANSAGLILSRVSNRDIVDV